MNNLSQPNVLMFGWEFPPFNSGGLGTACHGLTRALSSKNVPITFVLPRNIGAMSHNMKVVYADSKSIKFEVWNSLLKGYATSESYKQELMDAIKAGFAKDLLAEVNRYAAAASEIAQREDHNIIHAHDWLSFKAGTAAKKTSGKPLVLHVHATEFDRSSNNTHPEIYKIENDALREADRVVAVSDYTKKILTKFYDITQEKIDVIHNGVDLHEYELLKHDAEKLKQTFGKIVLFAGRLTIQKGPDYFLKAAKKVLEHDRNITFIISGSGDLEQQIMNDVVKHGLSDKIFFTGFLRGKDLYTVFQAADLFVMPSVSEPFGIAALESLANHTPILVSKQSGVGEILVHALKADFWDTDEMANKILTLLKYPSLSNCLRHHGRKEVEKYNWHSSADKCISLYQQLI
jgi:glycosyltransferase involved in cell wall biosynthesis